MTAAVESSVPNPHQHPLPSSLLTDPVLQDAPAPSNATKQQNGSAELALSVSQVQLDSKDIPPSPLTTTSPTEENSPSTTMATPSSVTTVEPPAQAGSSQHEVSHPHTEPIGTFKTPALKIPVPEDTLPEIPMYPPPVSPTLTYHPPLPSLPMVSNSKASKSAKRPTAKFVRRSWHPSHFERTLSPISPLTDSYGKIKRSASVASSGASSACSANSATVQIPQPCTPAYTQKGGRRRQTSDPKYLQFMSAVSQNQRQIEPERYIGYPGLVSHMTETQNLIFRRFDDIHVRLLLYLQDQITQLETALREMDEQNVEERGYHNGTFREDLDPLRVDILQRLRILVGEYDTIVLAFGRMQESKASQKAVERLRDWLKKHTRAPTGHGWSTNQGAISSDELHWVGQTNDLANLSITTTPNVTITKQSPLTRLFSTRKRR